jgi:DNA adenine methylase
MIPYIGGKSYLSSWIISNFPENYKEQTYCEVFGGGGWVLFKKDPSYVEIYNDLNSHLVNLFRVIRDNYEEFNHRAQWSLHSRELYIEAREKLKDDKFMSELEKAMYYSIEQVQSFSGRGGWGYVITAKKVVSGKWLPFLKRLELINARLKKSADREPGF